MALMIEMDSIIDNYWNVGAIEYGISKTTDSVAMRFYAIARRVIRGGDYLPVEYRASLSYSLQMFECIAFDQSCKYSDSALEVIRNVNDDLGIKLAVVRDRADVFQVVVSVEVKVVTMKDTVEVDGYDVYYTPVRYSLGSNPVYSFNNQTNNAVQAMPPGRYALWISLDGKVVQRRTIVIDKAKMEPIVFNIE